MGRGSPKAEALRGTHTRGGPPCAGAEVLHFPPPAEQQTAESRPQNRASVGEQASNNAVFSSHHPSKEYKAKLGLYREKSPKRKALKTPHSYSTLISKKGLTNSTGEWCGVTPPAPAEGSGDRLRKTSRGGDPKAGTMPPVGGGKSDGAWPDILTEHAGTRARNRARNRNRISLDAGTSPAQPATFPRLFENFQSIP